MNCEDVLDVLRADGGTAAARQEAVGHLAACDDCRAAAQALTALRADGARPIRVPRDGALQRAILKAVERHGAALPPPPRRLKLGAAVGGALAAGIALGALLVAPLATREPASAVPTVSIALDEVRDVRVAVNAPEALEHAAIRVVLRGSIGLDGYADERELEWNADLEPGVNQLTLPIVASGVGGGQVVVEVAHGDKRRTFVVDVRTTPSASRPSASRTDFGNRTAQADGTRNPLVRV
jgi:hypothetical protein